jgi:uncharacterized membrane protein
MDQIPRPLNSYTLDEKVAFFDLMYNSATEQFKKAEKGQFREDEKQFTWEKVMELLAPKDNLWRFWERFNSYFR